MNELMNLRDPDSLPADPWLVFQNWLEAGLALKSGHPDAIALGTVKENGKPAVRFVLHKGTQDNAIQFVTNYLSHKGKELDKNPAAALTYYWPEITRQIRVEGKISRASAAESDSYWQSRSRESQIGAWASQQSQSIASRDALDGRVADFEEKYRDHPIPRPPHWGMLNLSPESIEFLHLQSGRLHDRLLYLKEPAGTWTKNILAP